MGRNTAGKGEIAHYEQFLLFPQYFRKLVLQKCKNQGLFGKGLKTPCKKPFFEKIEGIGENAGNQHFLIFPQCFLSFLKLILIFQSYLL